MDILTLAGGSHLVINKGFGFCGHVHSPVFGVTSWVGLAYRLAYRLDILGVRLDETERHL